MESPTRSFVKSVSYRLLGSGTTMFVCYLLSRDVTLSVSAGLLDTIFKTGLYFLHERMWNHIPYGRRRPPEYEI